MIKNTTEANLTELINAFGVAVETMFDSWFDNLSEEDKIIDCVGCWGSDPENEEDVDFTVEVDVDELYDLLAGSDVRIDNLMREFNYKCCNEFFDKALDIYSNDKRENSDTFDNYIRLLRD